MGQILDSPMVFVDLDGWRTIRVHPTDAETHLTDFTQWFQKQCRSVCCNLVAGDRSAKTKHSRRQIHLFPMMVLVAPDNWIEINDTSEDPNHGFGPRLASVLVFLTFAPLALLFLPCSPLLPVTFLNNDSYLDTEVSR